MVDLEEANEIVHDRAVLAAASPGPWNVEYTDDALCMNAIVVQRASGDGHLNDSSNNIAIVLLQSPPYANVDDGKWHENAEFIARARSRWPAALDRVASLEQRVNELERQLAQFKRQ